MNSRMGAARMIGGSAAVLSAVLAWFVGCGDEDPPTNASSTSASSSGATSGSSGGGSGGSSGTTSSGGSSGTSSSGGSSGTTADGGTDAPMDTGAVTCPTGAPDHRPGPACPEDDPGKICQLDQTCCIASAGVVSICVARTNCASANKWECDDDEHCPENAFCCAGFAARASKKCPAGVREVDVVTTARCVTNAGDCAQVGGIRLCSDGGGACPTGTCTPTLVYRKNVEPVVVGSCQ